MIPPPPEPETTQASPPAAGGSPAPQEWREALRARLTGDSLVRADEPLARRTTLRVGGPADLYVEPASEGDLAEVVRFGAQFGVPLLVVGRGSNLLVRDGGVRGMVVCLAHPAFCQVQGLEDRLSCGAGARLKAVAQEACRRGLGGLEFLEGIPGTVGGALRMNAGAMGRAFFEVVDRVRCMDAAGQVAERRPRELGAEYRNCPFFRTHIALGAILRGEPAPVETIRQRLREFSGRRWATQPPEPSAGCMFKNPPGTPAGRLIDELGLKGLRVGGASVSAVHANFVVNAGGARARDVLELVAEVRRRVREARGIDLEPEVAIVGEDTQAEGRSGVS